MASNGNVKYKCPFCNDRMTREDLVRHVQDEHEDELPKDFTAFRYVFNYVNRKPLTYHGKCTECGGPTPWDENKGRYDRQCGKKACHDSFVRKFEENMLRTTGHTRMSDTAEGQVKMLANRKISGEYKFKDGGVKTYTGSYELKALEFMDKVMDIRSDDILAPGPILNYKLKDGREFMYITDFYYQPYNLVIEVKDGGNNPNRRNMPEYREKQIAKEQYIIKNTDFNYLRLTDNNLGQLIRVFADLKMQMVENGGSKRVIHVNENTEVVKESWIKNEKDILYNKEAFDNGDINLCFITGHCGSGKSTLAHSKESDKVEVYELDDLQWSFKYSDDNFKEYGDLIYSFFKGVGKRYRIPYQIEKDGKLCELTIDDVDQWFVDNGFKEALGDDEYDSYYEGATNAFVEYAIKYAKSHKDKKYIIEGIQLFLFVNPAKLKDYAVYIKGTSALISAIRGTKRDSMGKDLKSIADNIDTFIRRIVASMGKTGFEAKINSYRNYFKDKPETIKESYLEEVYDPDINYVDYVWNIAHTEQNAVVRLKSDKVNKYRGRSELIIIKGDEVLLNKNTKNKPVGAKFNYTLPGGGWNPGEDRSFSAQREAMEEVKIVTDDIKYVTTYTRVFPKDQIPTWVKLYFRKEDRWNGTYTEVYVGKYAGKYSGAINRIDKDPKMLNNSKFYKISEVYDGLAEAHKKAIDMYLSGASYVEESISADDTYHPVYIIAASYKSPLEKPIELVTGSKFAHACIALDPSFKKMYSFNGDHTKTLAHKFLGGFSAESIDLYKTNDPEALFRVHVVFLKDNDYFALEKKIKDLEFNKTHTQYNFLGLLDVPLGKKTTSDDEKMFCSQFVDSMFKFIDVDLTNKSSNLVTPADISRIRNKRVYKIFDGIVRNFNPKAIASKIKGLLGKAEYIKESTGDFEYVDLVEEEMRESVNHIVDEMMTAATYAPVVGLRDCDAYIVNYDQNRVFDKDSDFAVIDGSEKTIIRVDKDTKKLTKESFNPSYVQPRYAYRIGTLEEVSKVLAPYIDKEVSKDFIYETFFHKKLYTHDQLKAEAAYNDNIEVHMFKEEILAPYGTFVKTCDKHLDAILKEASEIGQIDSLIEEVCNG